MPETAVQLMQQALARLKEKRSPEGIEQLRRVVQMEPTLAEAWGHLAWQLSLAGRHDEAARCLEQLLGLEPANLEARWRLADRLVRLGRLEDAERQYRAALEIVPQCPDALAGLKCIEWIERQEARGQKQEVRGERLEARGQRQEAREEELRCAPSEGDESLLPTSHLPLPTSANERKAREHFARGDARLESLPFHLHIESSTRCNAACITCAKGHGPYCAEDMRPDVFERIERDLLPTAVQVNLTGSGEPLLARRFDHFYDEAARWGARVYLVTNATLLSMARLEQFARRPTDLIASIDGATRQTFEAIRRRSSFDRVTGQLQLYKKWRDLYPEVGSTLGINFVAFRRNIEELPALVDLAAQLGAQFISVLDFATGDLPPEIAREHLANWPDLANRMFEEAAQRAQRRAVVLHLPPKFAAALGPAETSWLDRLRRNWRLLPEWRRFPQRCPDPWTTALISTSGLVHPCCASRRVMGDLRQQSFAGIWNGPRYRRFRRWVNSALPPPECRNCNQLWGVNAGNPFDVQAREGALIKTLYAAERLAMRVLRCARRRLSRREPPRPNYGDGRPIREAKDEGGRMKDE